MADADLQFAHGTPTVLLTETEAIERLGLSDRPNPKGAIRWLVRVKRLKAVRVGWSIFRYDPADIEAFIKANRE